jgi:hypothetical protein
MFEFIKKNSFGITEEFKTKLLDFYAGLFREVCGWFVIQYRKSSKFQLNACGLMKMMIANSLFHSVS